MPLPIIEAPRYDVTLPISGLKLKFRPFLVKEEKILLMALEGGEEKEMVDAIRQIIVNCIIEIGGKDESKTAAAISSLPLVDFEYLFLKIRSKSVGETIELKYRCKNIVTGEEGQKECGNIVPIGLNIDEIELPVVKKEDKVIDLGGGVGITMSYPRYEIMAKLGNWEEKTNFEILIGLIKECIESIYDADQVYTVSDNKELEDFLDSLKTDQFNKIIAFFDKIPTLKKDLDFNCKKCGNKEVIHLNGVQSFFG